MQPWVNKKRHVAAQRNLRTTCFDLMQYKVISIIPETPKIEFLRCFVMWFCYVVLIPPTGA